MKLVKVINYIKVLLCIILSVCILNLSGCSLFNSEDSIMGVRSRAKDYVKSQSQALIDAITAKDVTSIKGQFCPLTQNIDGLEESILQSFSIFDGDIVSYQIKEDLGYEGYSTRYGTVTSYCCTGEIIKIYTTSGTKYGISYLAYIVDGQSIIGMNSYSIYEDYPDGYDYSYTMERSSVSVGHTWQSPYDAECTGIAVNLINAISGGDAEYLKSVCDDELKALTAIDNDIASVINLFCGEPLFTVHTNGIYGDEENDFSFRLGYELEPSRNNPQKISVSVYLTSIKTDTGDEYELSFYALLNYSTLELESISFLGLTNTTTQQSAYLSTPD
jgi:hypothetical protein